MKPNQTPAEKAGLAILGAILSMSICLPIAIMASTPEPTVVTIYNPDAQLDTTQVEAG